MFICKGSSRKRVVLESSRFYSPEELFDSVIDAQQRGDISIEYGPNLFEWVETELELKFVCKLIAGDHASYISYEDHEQHARDMEDSAHTEAYEKNLARNRSRKTRARGRALHRNTGGSAEGGCRNDSRSRKDKGSVGSTADAVVDAIDPTEPETTPEIPNLSVCMQLNNNSSYEEFPTSTDDAASGNESF